MSFTDFVKNTKKVFDKKYREHNHLVKEIEELYKKVWPYTTEEQKDRIKKLHKECQHQISVAKTNLEVEMNQKFEAEVGKLELDYMRKEIDVLQLWQNSIDARGAIKILTKPKWPKK